MLYFINKKKTKKQKILYLKKNSCWVMLLYVSSSSRVQQTFNDWTTYRVVQVVGMQTIIKNINLK